MQPEHFGVGDQMALIEMAMENGRGLDLLDNYIEAHVHGSLRIADDVEAVVLDPSFQGTPVEDAARTLPCAIEWHDGFRLSLGHLCDCERFRGGAAAEAIALMSVGGLVRPLEISKARAAGLNYQTAKWVWHCVARFGHT